MLAAGVFLCAGMLWKAAESGENRLWNVVGAAGWGLLAASAFTDGIAQIGLAVVSLGVFLLMVFARRDGSSELSQVR